MCVTLCSCTDLFAMLILILLDGLLIDLFFFAQLTLLLMALYDANDTLYQRYSIVVG